MNEVKYHRKWTEKILIRSKLYGTREKEVDIIEWSSNSNRQKYRCS